MTAQRVFQHPANNWGTTWTKHSGGLAQGAETSQPREKTLRAGNVAGNLRAQFIRPGELLFLAQAFPEANLDALRRFVPGKVQQVRLDAQRRAVEGRPVADIRHGIVKRVSELRLCDIHALGGQQLLFRRDVEGWKGERPPRPPP